MKMRDLHSSNSLNDGTRMLIESILVPEVAAAFKDWCKVTVDAKCVLIGGVALSHYVKPRSTTDADLLFMSQAEIPDALEGFKRHRPGAFLHKKTHVEIEVLTPASINIPENVAQAIYANARIENGVRIASPAGLVASKLKRFKLQDQADIEALCELGPIDLSPYPIPKDWLEKFEQFQKD